MSKQTSKTDSLEVRQGLRKLASELMDKFAKEKSALANYYNIKGSGKDLFLIAALIPALNTEGIIHDDIISIAEGSDQTKILDVSKKIAEWIYSNILKSKSKISNDLSGLEKDFFVLREKLSTKKDKPFFAILINDINNLPFDDLDWFQSVVLEALVSSPGSIVVVTSQNEIHWYPWEMRNKCNSEKLPAFSFEEILDLCESHPLAQKILELSAGHPKTVQSLVNAAKQKKAPLSFSEEDLNALNEEFVDILKREIDDNLYFKEKDQWLREVFYLASAADGFDADLIFDIIDGFNNIKTEKEQIKVPDEVTDIAWEMAYTGLVTWDFSDKIYLMNPELHKRIVQFMEHSRLEDLNQARESISKAYLFRGEILPDWSTSLVKYAKYTNESLNEIRRTLGKFLKTREDNILFIQSLRQESNFLPASKFQSLLEAYDVSTVIRSASQIKEDNMKTGIGTTNVVSATTTRTEIMNLFYKFLKGEIKDKWILHIEGHDGGIGKTHLLRRLKKHSVSEKKAIVDIDLHSPESRNALPILREFINQSGIANHEKIKTSLENLEKEIRSISKTKSLFNAEASKEQFDTPFAFVIQSIKDALTELAIHPVVFIDTLDASSLELTTWFLPKLMGDLSKDAHFVIAGRLPASSLLKPQWVLNIEAVTIGPLTETEIDELILNLKEEGILDLQINLPDSIIPWVTKLSDGNPLVFIWLLLYLVKFEKEASWLRMISMTREEVFGYIADKLFISDFDASLVEADKPVQVFAIQAAAHFGSHFNYELFSKSVPASALSPYSHEAIYKELNSKFFYYIRGTDKGDHWTLHDSVREWLINSYADHYFEIPPSLKKLSKNALENYYLPKIQQLKEIPDRTIEQQEQLDNLKVEQFYHRLFIEIDPQRPEKPLPYHRDLWNYLDYLWDHYLHYQMYQLIQYCNDLRRWKIPNSDLILSDLLHAAQAWLSYAQTDYMNARMEAEKVRKNSSHRRLKATANAVLGLIPSVDPEEAFNKLKLARDYYEELIDELTGRHFYEDEFTDSLDKIYPELHLVLMSIGRAHLRYFDDLNKGIDALEAAYKNSKKTAWRKPLYSAVALNEWARILRFQGDYSDALNKVMTAIFIYKKEKKKPEFDANFGYFYETLGLVYKELAQFEHALNALDIAYNVYKNIPNMLDTRLATITLEKGHVLFLSKEREQSLPLLEKAFSIFSENIEKNPSYYLSSINKLGEYYLAEDELEKAEEYFHEQKKVSEKYNHRFWLYLAEQSLAEVKYKRTQSLDKVFLEEMLREYSNERGYQLGPAYWRTKHLLYSYAKESEKNSSASITHLAQGLTYLSEHWKGLFWKNLVLLRNELLELDAGELEKELLNIVSTWKQELPDGDSTHPFITTFETIRESLK